MAGGSNPFNDVDPDSTHGEAINALAEREMVQGYDNGNFGPQDEVTRGQVASMLWSEVKKREELEQRVLDMEANS